MVVVIELMVALILKATRAMGTSCAPGQGVSLTHDSEQDIFSVSPRLERNKACIYYSSGCPSEHPISNIFTSSVVTRSVILS